MTRAYELKFVVLTESDLNYDKLPGSGEDEEVRQPPESCFDFAKDHDSDHSLAAGLSNARNVVSDWRGALENSFTNETNIFSLPGSGGRQRNPS